MGRPTSHNAKQSRPVTTIYPKISTAVGQAVQAVLLGKASRNRRSTKPRSRSNGILSRAELSSMAWPAEAAAALTARGRTADQPAVGAGEAPDRLRALRGLGVRGAGGDPDRGVRPDPDRVVAAALACRPTTCSAPRHYIGLANYKALAKDPQFRSAIGHTIVYTVIFVPVSVIGALGLAVALNRRIRGIRFYRLACSSRW